MKTISVAIILVEPENPDNIGAVARAMKNMGLRDLRLVKPPRSWKKRAKKLAMNAADLLTKASVYPSLKEAVRDCQTVAATSCRFGARRGFFVPLEKAVPKIRQAAQRNKAAIVFGKESKGLANRDLKLCDFILTIPSHKDYRSLNLAQAVMVIGFALFVFHTPGVETGKVPLHSTPVSKHEIEEILGRLEKAFSNLGYRYGRANVLGRVLETFRGLFNRAGLLHKEAQMFRGLTRRILTSKFSDKVLQ